MAAEVWPIHQRSLRIGAADQFLVGRHRLARWGRTFVLARIRRSVFFSSIRFLVEALQVLRYGQGRPDHLLPLRQSQPFALTELESKGQSKQGVFRLRIGIMFRSDGTCRVPEFQFCPTDRGHLSMTIALETILEPAVLRRVWKDVRKREREIHLTQIPLVRDSTGGIAFELSLSDVLENLRLRLLEGTYRPHAPIIIEGAKSKLLHRRRSFLAFEDGLILGGLVQAARATLMKKMPAWVSFGQLDQPKKKSKEHGGITFDYESWWTKWLQYRGLLKVIEGDPNPLLVVSDITNFFASIDLSLLRSKVSGETLLDEKATNLLFYLLENLRPAEGYSPSGSLGLPTVADDTSRILAHFYLAELDEELIEEGQSGRYTRWVDDMVISVPDAVEGGKVVTRIERALLRVGLVANSSKTDLVPKDVFRESHHEEENEYLDEVHQAIKSEEKFTSEDQILFEKRLTSFLCSPKEGNWSRILRRYYTESRRVRSTILLTHWKDHLAEYPTNSDYILDYVSFFPGDMEFCDQLFWVPGETRASA